MRRWLAPVLLCPLLAGGCAEHWAKPGATPLERDAALARCEAESHARFPPVLHTVMASPGYFVPPRTQCWTANNRTQCATSGGYWMPPTYHTIDMNARGRTSARIDCMYDLGWMLAKDEKEADAVTRSGAMPPTLARP